MGSLVYLFFLVSVCMPGCYLPQACRSVPLQLHAGEVQKPYLSRCVKLASTVSALADKAASLSTASSLLSLLGGKQQALSVDPVVAHQILPYLRFLVPPDLPRLHPPSRLHGSLLRSLQPLIHHKITSREPFIWREELLVDNLIHWPPPAVADLARKAVEWNGDASVILNSLSEERHLVPDVEGSNEHHCQLTKYISGQRFVKEELNHYFAFLFETIAALAPSVGFNVTLNRFDLFHGHLFLANDTGRLGILFHAREYPAYNEETFPVHLGYCQVASPLPYDDSMNLRNILWLAPMPDCSSKICTSKNCTSMAGWLAPGTLLVLDAHPQGIIYKNLVPDWVDVVRTVYEDDFGDVIVDVNYFRTPNDKLVDRLYIC